MPLDSTYTSWYKRLQARAANNSLSHGIRITHSGILYMSYSNNLVSVLEILRQMQISNSTSKVPLMNAAHLTLDDAEQSQTQLYSDFGTITMLSVPIVWFYLVAAVLWIASATVFIRGLRKLSMSSVSTILRWGLVAASLGLLLAIRSPTFGDEFGWAYILMFLTPGYLAMTISLSFVVEGNETESEKGDLVP